MVASIFLLEHYCSVPGWVGVAKTNLAGHSFVSSDSATLEGRVTKHFPAGWTSDRSISKTVPWPLVRFSGQGSHRLTFLFPF